jgi:ADP-L-glycero-D-manno-heptose 6-epimerase
MIIVTGGAGFIGSAFIAELNAVGYTDILVVDNLTNDKWKNISNKRITQFLHKDKFREIIAQYAKNVCSNDYFEINKLEAIFHLGACSATTETDVNYLMDNNFLFSKELAIFSISHNIRFIYASSAATYGDPTLSDDFNGKVDKSLFSDSSIYGLIPLNPYGFSKQLFDLWIIENGYENKVTGIKYFNVFGPNEYHKGSMRSMFLKAFEQIQEIGKVKLFKSNNSVYTDGEQKRDFVYVKDCTNIMLKMMLDKSFTGIYNLGTGKARSWNDLANAIFNAMIIPSKIEYIDMPIDIAKQYQCFTEADNAKIVHKLGGNFKWTSIEDAAMDYVQNYLSKGKIW